MAEIICLSDIRRQGALRDGFSAWNIQFSCSFALETCLKDLDHAMLRQLADPGEVSTRLINTMVIGFLELGTLSFDELNQRQQSRIIDIQLFLADQIHFEMMLRLGWLTSYGGQKDALFDMVRCFDASRQHYQTSPPTLSPAFPEYNVYAALIDREKQVFIRRLIPGALNAFAQEFVHE